MNPFAGKSSTERNKMIAAIVLGFVALTALYLAFGRSSSATNIKVETKATPKPSSSNNRRTEAPSQVDQSLLAAVPINYQPSYYGADAPDPGRNIFAFTEPPPCYPNCPKPPEPIKTPPTPTPTP